MTVVLLIGMLNRVNRLVRMVVKMMKMTLLSNAIIYKCVFVSGGM